MTTFLIPVATKEQDGDQARGIAFAAAHARTRELGRQFVVREDYGAYFAVPADDAGYRGIGVLCGPTGDAAATEVAVAIIGIRGTHRALGGTLDGAARKWMCDRRRAALDVMETIGSWPSSEPELAALQRVWR